MHRRRWAASALIVLAILSIPGVGRAHKERALEALTVIERVRPEIKGVAIWVDHITAPALVARNRTDRWLVFIGRDEKPFLRIRRGSVELNAASPTTYAVLEPGGSLAPASAKRGAAPRWTRVAARSTWSWFDPRLHYRGPNSEWVVDARYGSHPVTIQGGFEHLESHGHFEVELAVRQDLEGLEVRLLPGPIPGLFVRNATDEVLTVPGPHGEPFLRIGPDGVEANVNSPAYYLGGSQTIAAVPPRARAAIRPDFRRVSPAPTWAWLELKARLPVTATHRVELGDEQRVVHRWTTPMTLGDETLSVTGSIVWNPAGSAVEAPRPPTSPSSLNPLPIAAALGALIYVASVFSSLRRPAAEPS